MLMITPTECPKSARRRRSSTLVATLSLIIASSAALVIAQQHPSYAAEDCGSATNNVVTLDKAPTSFTQAYNFDFCAAESAADEMSATADSLNGCTISGATVATVSAALAGKAPFPVVIIGVGAGAGLAGTCGSQAKKFKDASNLLNKAIKECKQAGASGIAYQARASFPTVFRGWVDLADVRCAGGQQVSGSVRFNATALTGAPWSMEVKMGSPVKYKFGYLLTFYSNYTWDTSGDGRLTGTWSPNGSFEADVECAFKFTANSFSFGFEMQLKGDVSSLCEPPTGKFTASSF